MCAHRFGGSTFRKWGSSGSPVTSARLDAIRSAAVGEEQQTTRTERTNEPRTERASGPREPDASFPSPGFHRLLTTAALGEETLASASSSSDLGHRWSVAAPAEEAPSLGGGGSRRARGFSGPSVIYPPQPTRHQHAVERTGQEQNHPANAQNGDANGLQSNVGSASGPPRLVRVPWRRRRVCLRRRRTWIRLHRTASARLRAEVSVAVHNNGPRSVLVWQIVDFSAVMWSTKRARDVNI